jgi:hypothetical protein
MAGGPSPRDSGILARVPARPVKDYDAFRYWRDGKRDEPEPSYVGLVEDPGETPVVGICCSGGGIRSAAFNLGALQSLIAKRVLQSATYLSAVSGGSYIAASLFMVAKTKPGPDDSDPAEMTAETPPFHPGSPEEQYLRNRCAYLAPGGSGKLLLAFRVLMGLTFNLFFLGLVLVSAGILFGALIYNPWYGDLDGERKCTPGERCFTANVPDGAWWVVGVLGGAIVFIGLLILLSRTSSETRRIRRETWVVRFIVAETVVVVILVLAPALLEALRNYAAERGAAEATGAATSPALPAVSAGSLASLILAVLLQVRAKASEPATVLKAATGFRAWLAKLGPRARLAFAYLVGALAGPIVLLSIFLAGASFAVAHAGDTATGRGLPFLVLAACLLVFTVLYFFADLTSWSLHPFYKRRLCTAFALRRVKGDDNAPEARERDYERRLLMSQMALEDDPPPGADSWPTLIVCTAANVSDPGATAPGRGVTSFTFSPTAIGGPLIGSVETKRYEDALGHNRQRDITLPAVVAMSGAALSPSMGKLTRKPLTFLMALANVRLGVWIPNPRWLPQWERHNILMPWRVKSKETAKDYRKRPRPSYLLRELLGRNRIDGRFLYVSDGGHYENLGLVELLRRGCRRIYCFDASGGTGFKELGDALALARSELEVEIDIDPSPLVAKGDNELAEHDCVAGTITYPGNIKGTLVYARTVMTAAVPFDVRAYHEGDKTFPHDSTANQLYTDQKFEAYRALGVVAGEHAIAEMEQALAAETEPEPVPADATVTMFDASEHLPALPPDETVARPPTEARFRRGRVYVTVGIEPEDGKASR